jgi:hypothetical protein
MPYVYEYTRILNMFSIWAICTEIQRKQLIPLSSVICEEVYTFAKHANEASVPVRDRYGVN